MKNNDLQTFGTGSESLPAKSDLQTFGTGSESLSAKSNTIDYVQQVPLNKQELLAFNQTLLDELLSLGRRCPRKYYYSFSKKCFKNENEFVATNVQTLAARYENFFKKETSCNTCLKQRRKLKKILPQSKGSSLYWAELCQNTAFEKLSNLFTSTELEHLYAQACWEYSASDIDLFEENNKTHKKIKNEQNSLKNKKEQNPKKNKKEQNYKNILLGKIENRIPKYLACMECDARSQFKLSLFGLTLQRSDAFDLLMLIKVFSIMSLKKKYGIEKTNLIDLITKRFRGDFTYVTLKTNEGDVLSAFPIVPIRLVFSMLADKPVLRQVERSALLVQELSTKCVAYNVLSGQPFFKREDLSFVRFFFSIPNRKLEEDDNLIAKAILAKPNFILSEVPSQGIAQIKQEFINFMNRCSHLYQGAKLSHEVVLHNETQEMIEDLSSKLDDSLNLLNNTVLPALGAGMKTVVFCVLGIAVSSSSINSKIKITLAITFFGMAAVESGALDTLFKSIPLPKIYQSGGDSSLLEFGISALALTLFAKDAYKKDFSASMKQHLAALKGTKSLSDNILTIVEFVKKHVINFSMNMGYDVSFWLDSDSETKTHLL